MSDATTNDDAAFGIFESAIFGGIDPDQLRKSLNALLAPGRGCEDPAYFRRLRETVLHLVVDAPARVEDGIPYGVNPPTSAREFLRRFDMSVLAELWGGSLAGLGNVEAWTGVPHVDYAIVSALEGKQPMLARLHREYLHLFRSYGAQFDAPPSATGTESQ
ncbi:hypothetical protein AB0C65_38245 [Nocardia sp. NPDC048505]|uniref:hypothetical protein n=1 Tax=Nocardia sp. NPDC048505 TaxID=3155756 RepID=UPI0033E69B24